MKKITLLATLLFGSFYLASAQNTWSELCSPTSHINANGAIYALDTDPHGNVYAAGAFKLSSGASEVMKFNGTTWSQVGTLSANGIGIRHILVKDSNDIYACGWFTNSSGYTYVAHWDGTSWREVGGTSTSPLHGNGPVWDLGIDNSGNLYACGYFTNSSGMNYVAKWDGTVWSEVGTGANSLGANSTVWDLEIDNSNNIYVSGYFTDNQGFRYAAKWNGTTWTTLTGTTGLLNANNIITMAYLDKTKNEYYVGGRFKNNNGNQYVAKWDGSNWSQVGNTPFNGDFVCMIQDNAGNLLAAGAHTNSSGFTSVYKWDGLNWIEVNGTTGPLNGSAATYWLALNKGILYTSGYFTDASALYYVAKTDYLQNSQNTGLKTELSNQSPINITPNPAADVINFACPNNFIGGEYFIYNQIGALLEKGKLNEGVNTFNVGNYKQGYYTIKLQKGIETNSTNWIKN